MTTTSLRFLMSFALALGLGLAQAADPKEAAEPAVKKSDSGICHDKTSASYGNTKMARKSFTLVCVGPVKTKSFKA